MTDDAPLATQVAYAAAEDKKRLMAEVKRLKAEIDETVALLVAPPSLDNHGFTLPELVKEMIAEDERRVRWQQSAEAARDKFKEALEKIADSGWNWNLGGRVIAAAMQEVARTTLAASPTQLQRLT